MEASQQKQGTFLIGVKTERNFRATLGPNRQWHLALFVNYAMCSIRAKNVSCFLPRPSNELYIIHIRHENFNIRTFKKETLEGTKMIC